MTWNIEAENRALIAQRWPELLTWIEASEQLTDVGVEDDVPAPTLVINSLRLASAYAPHLEAELQVRLIPPGARAATVYGLGNGAVARLLLSRPELEQLRVVLLDASVVGACLTGYEMADWLGDARVELVRAEDESGLRTPFVALPTCLKLAASPAWRIRDLVELELSTPHLRSRMGTKAEELAGRMQANRAALATDGDVAELFGTHAASTVFVAAAGPTLADHFDRLRARPAGELLVAVDATLKPLLAAGIRPDFVVACDSHELGLTRIFDIDPAEVAGTVLVYDPVVYAGVVAAWSGRRVAFYRDHPRYADLQRELPRGVLWSSGSVLHPAVDLAVRMGAARVVLMGADFANLRGQSHVAGAAWNRTVGPRAGRAFWLLDGRGRRIDTQPNLVGYLRDLEVYVARHADVAFFQASLASAAIVGVQQEQSDERAA